jgi:hypothetical protein
VPSGLEQVNYLSGEAIALIFIGDDWADGWGRYAVSQSLVSSRPSAPKDPSDRRHRIELPAQLGEDPGRDERSDEDREPDANHGQHAITAQPGRNRVFPSKEGSFPPETFRSSLQIADLRLQHHPVSPDQVGTKSSTAAAAGTGGVMASGGPVCRRSSNPCVISWWSCLAITAMEFESTMKPA